jgi:hypothetical protein
MDALWGQAIVFFPMVETSRFITLQATGRLTAQDFGVSVIEFPMQQLREHHANLRHGHGRREIFSPFGFPA